MEEQTKKKLILRGVSLIVLIALVLLLHPFVLVTAGHRAVILRLGAVNRVLSEGLHWKTPIVENAEKLDVRTQKIEVPAPSASRDLQTVSAVIALNYHLVPDRVGELWRNLGENYQRRVVDPAIQESVKAATAQFTAEELITKRPTVREAIELNLTEKLSAYFVVDELNIVDFDFSEQFNSAIEAKVTAEQQALAAKNKLEQVKFEKEQRIAQAQGEAEAIRIQAQAITQQGGRDYVQLKSIEKWNGQLPVNLYGSAPIPFLNINQ